MRKYLLLLALIAGCSDSEHPTEILLKDGADGKDAPVGITCPNGEQGTLEALPETNSIKVTCEGFTPILILNGGQGAKGDKGDKGEFAGRPFKLYEDAGKCLWFEFTDNGEKYKLRGPL